MSRAEARIAVSEAVQHHALSGVEGPSYVVYNGVISRERLEQLNLKQKESSGGPFTFAIVGQISPAKGQKQALRALHQLRQEGGEARLLVAGDGASEHLESLQQLCQSLNLGDAVSFLGYVSDPFEVYQRADAVLMCSPNEAMGRVTAEAMAAACPVIGYNSDGTAELIDDEKNGLLYDGTTKHLVRCMRRLVDEPAWLRSLGESSHEKAGREFTNEVYAYKVYRIFCDVLGVKKV
jgi:glycosyltransferase involved in cell wall biosynthesis